MGAESNPESPSFELRGTLDGRPVVFERLELWWSEAEPPEQTYASFTLVTSAEAPSDAPRVEVECPAPDATTFRDLAGETFALAPLSGASGGWVSVDLGRDYKARGFAARAWVAREARVVFGEKSEPILEGRFEAVLERSAAKGGPQVGQAKLAGQFRARAPKW